MKVFTTTMIIMVISLSQETSADNKRFVSLLQSEQSLKAKIRTIVANNSYCRKKTENLEVSFTSNKMAPFNQQGQHKMKTRGERSSAEREVNTEGSHYRGKVEVAPLKASSRSRVRGKSVLMLLPTIEKGELSLACWLRCKSSDGTITQYHLDKMTNKGEFVVFEGQVSDAEMTVRFELPKLNSDKLRDEKVKYNELRLKELGKSRKLEESCFYSAEGVSKNRSTPKRSESEDKGLRTSEDLNRLRAQWNESARKIKKKAMVREFKKMTIHDMLEKGILSSEEHKITKIIEAEEKARAAAEKELRGAKKIEAVCLAGDKKNDEIIASDMKDNEEYKEILEERDEPTASTYSEARESFLAGLKKQKDEE